MNMYYRSTKNRKDEGEEPCRKCGTTGVTTRQIHLREVCEQCNGEGFVDWVSNITDTRSQKSIKAGMKEQLHVENVHHLIREIKSIFYQHGLTTIVEVKALQDNYNPRPQTLSIDDVIGGPKQHHFKPEPEPPQVFKKIISV